MTEAASSTPQRRADLRHPAYRVGGPRERCIWNGEELVWVTDHAPVSKAVTPADDGLMPEFSFRGRNV